MAKVLTKILKIITKKEVYGSVIILAVSYFFYHTLSIIVEEMFSKASDKYETKKRNTVIKLFKNITKYIILII